MEGIILLGLAGAGYMINKNSQSNRIETNVRPPVFQNSNTSIYDLNNVADSQQLEKNMIDNNFKKTLDSQSNMVSDFNAKDKMVEPQIIGLDGNPISKDDFMKNDQGITMEPFFRGEGPTAIN